MTAFSAFDWLVKKAQTVSTLNLVASASLLAGGIVLGIVGGGLFWVTPALALPGVINQLAKTGRQNRRKRVNDRLKQHELVRRAKQASIIETAQKVKELEALELGDAAAQNELVHNLMNSNAVELDALESERFNIH